MARYAVAHLDDIEELDGPGCRYRPIRHQLGISAFGANAWTGRSVGDVIILPHDEDDPTRDEELFLVLRGEALFELDGDEVEAPAGTLVSTPPRTRRSAVAKEAGTMILAIEGSPGKGYDARGWELWAPLFPLYEAGQHAEVADRLQAVVEASPQYPLLFFNLACCQSVLGRTAPALENLRRAIEMSDEFLENAKTDPDLDPIRDEAEFQRLVGSG